MGNSKGWEEEDPGNDVKQENCLLILLVQDHFSGRTVRGVSFASIPIIPGSQPFCCNLQMFFSFSAVEHNEILQHFLLFLQLPNTLETLPPILFPVS